MVGKLTQHNHFISSGSQNIFRILASPFACELGSKLSSVIKRSSETNRLENSGGLCRFIFCRTSDGLILLLYISRL